MIYPSLKLALVGSQKEHFGGVTIGLAPKSGEANAKSSRVGRAGRLEVIPHKGNGLCGSTDLPDGPLLNQAHRRIPSCPEKHRDNIGHSSLPLAHLCEHEGHIKLSYNDSQFIRIRYKGVDVYPVSFDPQGGRIATTLSKNR
jgi:hypothetical protein